MDFKILVTGASGPVGSDAVSHLRRIAGRFVEITAGVYERSRKRDQKHIWQDAHKIQYLDFDAISAKELSRYHVIVLVPTTSASRTRQVFNVCTAYNQRVEEKFLVLCSASQILRYETEWSKGFRAMENIVAASGIPYTFLQSGFLFQNFFHHAEQLMRSHELRMPLGHGKFAPIHASDVGRAAAKVALNPKHYAEHAFNLVGQMLVSGDDIADIATQAFGYKVRFKDIPLTNYREFLLDRGVSQFAAESLCEFCEMIRTHKLDGPGSTTSSIVLNLLDNKITSLKTFFIENEGTFGATGKHSGGYEDNAEEVRQRRLTERDILAEKGEYREGVFPESQIPEVRQMSDSDTYERITGGEGPGRNSWKQRESVGEAEVTDAAISEQLNRIYLIMRDMTKEQRGLVHNYEERINRELQDSERVSETYKPIRAKPSLGSRRDSAISISKADASGERAWRYGEESEGAPKKWRKPALVRDLNLDRLPSTRLSRERSSRSKSGKDESLLHRIGSALYGKTGDQKTSTSHNEEKPSKFSRVHASRGDPAQRTKDRLRKPAANDGVNGERSYMPKPKSGENSRMVMPAKAPAAFDDEFAEYSDDSASSIEITQEYYEATTQIALNSGDAGRCARCSDPQKE